MNTNKKCCIGILAHVDAGKTTLCESMLYTAKAIRQLGRVDKGNAFLDTDETEKKRGITIYSKTATFTYGGLNVVLLDTPGHADFSAEMERTLSVLDYCILVIDGSQRFSEYTKLQFNLLKEYKVPVFVFVNKWDRATKNKDEFVSELKEFFKDEFVCFDDEDNMDMESIAATDEEYLAKYLENDTLGVESLQDAISKLLIYPCYFGSALKVEGIDTFLNGIEKYTANKEYCAEPMARVYKILHDPEGNRLTFAKIIGGSFKIRDEINGEKINRIRIYSGEKYENVTEAVAGDICAFVGLNDTYAGQGIGDVEEGKAPVILPVMTYTIEPVTKIDMQDLYQKLKKMWDEEPQMMLTFDEHTKEIRVSIMGEIQRQIIKEQIKKRYDVDVEFGKGTIAYKETISEPSYGVGHFEPLRHYGEVHVLIEPGKAGSGIEVESDLSEDLLDKNWQRLILNNLKFYRHKGVLTGSQLTDVKLTLKAGKAHNKHSQTTDFCQSVIRAVRHGLMKGKSKLLEPYYTYTLSVPQSGMGKAMTDMENRHASVAIDVMGTSDDDICVLKGKGPVSTLWDYAKDIWAYTKGKGAMSLEYAGYGECHNEEEVIMNMAYNPLADMANPPGSVFCAHGAGFHVEWDRVEDYMHLDNALKKSPVAAEEKVVNIEKQDTMESLSDRLEGLGTEEIDAILNKTFNANKKSSDSKNINSFKKTKVVYDGGKSGGTATKNKAKNSYLLVDGYNIVHAWEETKDLVSVSFDGARDRLLEILSDYAGTGKDNIIVVFDAYKTSNAKESILTYHNINVVYTKQAQTADAYIEKFTHENANKYNITVATSDGVEQMIIRGTGCNLVSARDFEKMVKDRRQRLKEQGFYSDGESVGNKVGIDLSTLELSKE